MKSVIYIFSVCWCVAACGAEPASKRELAKAVLVELGVPARFDVYLTRGADQLAGGDIRDMKTHKWLQNLWIQELGWTTVERAYVEHFQERFSEAELRELLQLSKNVTLRKLIDEELTVFRATFEQRNRTFARFWHRYNAMEFSPEG